jgi:hypothetical protein
MIALIVAVLGVVGALAIGLWVWDLRIRARMSETPTLHADSRPGFSGAQRSAPPRFKGSGTVPSRAPRSPRRNPIGAGKPAPPSRFSGTTRRNPDAIGVACGRPISQCTRGKDCLCID